MKYALQCLVVLALALGVASCSAERPVEPVQIENARPKPWPKEAVDAFGRVPLQERGRIKPMSTFIGFRMLNVHGSRKHVIPAGFELPTGKEKLDPVRWALDVMYYPEQAAHYEVFVVDDRAVLERVGLRFENRKRKDRYSYAQLKPARWKIIEEAARLERKQATNGATLTREEKQLQHLEARLLEYESIQALAGSGTVTIGESPSDRLLELFPEGAAGAPFSYTLAAERWPQVVDWVKDVPPKSPAFVDLQRELYELSNGMQLWERAERRMPSVFPHPDPSVAEWMKFTMPGIMRSAQAESNAEGAYSADPFVAAGVPAGDMDAMVAAIVATQAEIEKAATGRGEFADIDLEISYYKGDYFVRALVLFLLGFLTMAFSWMSPKLTKLTWGTWGFAGAGLVLVTAGVTMRCMLMNRPPVATLYETILFITGVAVIVCLIMEKITKEKIALTAAVVLGAAGMFLAMKYELREAKMQGDTMGGLLAVLNTNFWLATHVTTVTMGYSAGILAAGLGLVWLVMRIGRSIVKGEEMPREVSQWYGRYARMTYGVICFGLLFATVGTILGGVWANDSWGRFWGWDPKENGALMIVLYQLVIVHSRLGGYVRDFGTAVLSVVGGGIVTFSWWHVNELGVGLHSYGQTEGVLTILNIVYFLVAAVVVLSVIFWLTLLRPSKLPAA